MIKDFKNKKVVVMGLGLHEGGVGVVKFLAQQRAKVIVTDLKTEEELKESIKKLGKYQIKYVLGKHRVGDFKNADLIIKNPGVPRDSKYLKIARKNKIPIETDIGLFFELCPSKKIIGVTGTKGKSTTATLIAELLKTKPACQRGRYKVVLAGNIRASVLEELPKVKKNTIVVLELSSWQLEDLKPYKKSPHIAVITNIMQDHLNRYKGIGDYIKAKKLIFKFQKPKDILILNHDDKIVKNFAKEAKAKTIFYSKKQTKKYLNQTKLIGEHNLSNLSAAIAVAKLFKISSFSIKKVLKNFKAIEGRLEFIKKINGVKYYNDTTATTPEATISALKSFPSHSKIILIAGGTDKNLNFRELAETIIKRVKLLILLPGTATKKILKKLKVKSQKLKIQVVLTKNMHEAVKGVKGKKGDIVILSPGCASFGLFKHEFDRGEQFKKCIRNL